MKKKILTITICVLVLFSLFVLPAAAWGVTVPDGGSESTGTITAAEFNSSTKTFSAYRSSSSTVQGGYIDPQGSWSVVTKSVAGVSGSALQYTLTNNQNYTLNATETFVGLSDFYMIDADKFDVYLRSQTLAVEVYHGGGSWSSYNPTSVSIVPYYAKLDGSDLMADNAHALNITSFQTTNYTNYARWHVTLTTSQAMAISASNIPDGYVLYGVGYRWTFNGTLASTTRFYIGNLGYSLYFSSTATTEAIGAMSDKLSADIQSLGDRMSAAIEEKADEILKGWIPDPVAPDGSDDITEFEQQEQELIESQTEGINTAVGVVSGIDSGLLNFGKGFTVMINIFDYFLDNKWLNSLLLVSLGLGIVAFTLGVVPSIIRSIGDREVRSDSEPRGKYDVKVLNLFVNKH